MNKTEDVRVAFRGFRKKIKDNIDQGLKDPHLKLQE